MKRTDNLSLFILNLSVLTFSCAQIILFALVPVLVESLALSYEKILGSLALGTTLFIWGSPYWAKKSETLGRLNVLRIGLAGLCLSLLLIVALVHFRTSLSETVIFAGLILSRLTYGAFSSGMIPVTQLLRLDQASDQNANVLFKHSFYINIGRTAGLLLLLLAHEHFLLLLLSLVLVGSSLAFFSLKVDVASPVVGRTNTSEKFSKSFLFPLSISILFTTYVGILHSSLGVTLKNVFSLKGDEATVLMSEVLIVGSFAIAFVQFVGTKVFRQNIGYGLLTGLIFLGSGAIGLSRMTSGPELWISIIVVSAGIGLIQPSHVSLVHRQYKDKGIGSKLGLLASGNTIGYAVGGSVASVYLQSSLGLISFIVIALLYVFASGQYLEVFNENR